MRTSVFAILLTLAALAGCTRSVPSALPRASAASPEAGEGPRLHVGLAITEEPPPPGERREGWEALERGAPSDEAGAHHGHHGHHRHHGPAEEEPSTGAPARDEGHDDASGGGHDDGAR